MSRKNRVVEFEDTEIPTLDERPCQGGSNMLIFSLVAIALILAVAFFYVSKRQEARTGNESHAAENSEMNGYNVIGQAAKNAIGTINNDS